MGCGGSTEAAEVPQKVEAQPEVLDEFDERSVKPVDKRLEDLQRGFYKAEPGEEVTTYFESCYPGLLYRIVKGNTWSFYNASRVYEMDINFTFTPNSEITPLGKTKMSTDENGDLVTQAVCYPNELIEYLCGSVDMITSKIRALPLSENYLRGQEAKYRAIIDAERQAMKTNPSVSAEEALESCIKDGTMFVDREFLPSQESVTKGSRKAMKPVPWARPQMYLAPQLVEHIRLFRREPRPSEVSQSVLGDSWVVSGLSALAKSGELVKSCFYHPRDPKLTRLEQARGAYRVTINKDGWWQNYIVDSYLPVIGSQPKFARSNTEVCEMWVSILEKVYAKAFGSYAQIIAGDPLMLMQDLSGFPTSRYDDAFCTQDPEDSINFARKLENHLRRNHFVIVHTPCRDRTRSEGDRERQAYYTEADLVMGHAYVVEEMHLIKDDNTDTALLRICNPWGRGIPWAGEWREGSDKWSKNQEAAQKCQSGKAGPMSFWIEWKEALRYFSGCGVMFTNMNAIDYRVCGLFQNEIPTVSLEISVKKSIKMTFILSVPDHRGTSEAEKEYHPILLSLGQGSGDPAAIKIIKNTHLDVEQPSKLFSFIQSRDVAMTVSLDSDHSPYVLVPRIMAEGASSPYRIGILTEEPCGSENLSVRCFQRPATSKVFTNFPMFDSTEGVSVSTTFQVRPVSRAFPTTHQGTDLIPPQ